MQFRRSLRVLAFLIWVGYSAAAAQDSIPYVPSPMHVVHKMIEVAQIKKGDILYDMGSGDGRIVIEAAKKFGIRGVWASISIPSWWLRRGKMPLRKASAIWSSSKTEPGGKPSWGLLSCIDLYECDPKIIRDAEAIKKFVARLCDLIKMKRFGETQVVHFGEDERVAGFSMTQLIETSLISAHFANQTNTTYLDVFSCKAYDPEVVAEFAKSLYKAKKVKHQTVDRE